MEVPSDRGSTPRSSTSESTVEHRVFGYCTCDSVFSKSLGSDQEDV